MADFTHIIEEINTNLPDNNTQSITAAKLRNTLIDLTNTIDNVQDDYELDVTGQFNAFKRSVESEFGTLQTNIETEFDELQTNVETALDNLIVDSLDSTSTTSALSANQGRILNEEIGNKVNVSEGVDFSKYLPTEKTQKYITTSGTISSEAGTLTYGVTDFIPLTPDIPGVICSNVRNSSSVIGCALYTDASESSFVGRASYTGGSTTISDTSIIYVKTGERVGTTVYVRFSIYNVSDINDVTIKAYPTSVETPDTPIRDYVANELSKDTSVVSRKLFEVKAGKNLFDKNEATLGTGLYINSSGSFAISGTATIGVTGYIPFGDNTVIKIAGKYDNLPTSRNNCIYDSNFNLVRAQQNPYIVKNAENDETYVRFTIPSAYTVDNLMIVGVENDVSEYSPYEQDITLSSDFAPEISVGNIDKTETVFLSTNICNPDECIWDNTKYIGYNSGNVNSTSASSSRLGCTGFIPLDEQGARYAGYYDNNNAIGGAYYDKNFKYISGFYNANAYWAEGRAYARWTIGSGQTPENIFICKGTADLPYEPYAGKKKVISKEILPNFQEGGLPTFYDGVTVNLPSTIYVSKGDRLQIFWKNVVTAFNPYVFNVCGVCSVGRSYPRYYQLDATSGMVGKTYTITTYVRDNQGNTIANGSTSIKVVNTATSPANATNILIIGASATAGGNIISELDRRITKTSGSGTYAEPTGLGLSNIYWVGRKQPISSRPDLRQEANSGWAWKDFATVGRYAYRFFINDYPVTQLYEGDVYSGAGTLKFTITEINLTDGVGYISATYSGSGTTPASGTLTLSSGDGDATIKYDSFNIDSGNPFWNDTTGSLDFVTYANTYCNGSIDIMISHLGVNDIFSDRDGTTTVNTYIKPFLDAFHTQFPNAKFIISTLPLCSPFGGMTESYGATLKNEYWTKAKKFWDYASAFNELVNLPEYSSWVTLSTPLHTFDSENLYPSKTVNVDNRNTAKTETVQTNGVHPTAIGSYTVADDIYHSIMKILA